MNLFVISKRWMLWSFLTFGQLLPTIGLQHAGHAIQNFHRLWWLNKGHIVTLTAINTSITFATELVSRTAFVEVGDKQTQNSFIVTTPEGHKRIHRQSMINILMTLFASLFGGPVFFIKSRMRRFIFFVAFGLFNSLLSQTIVGGLATSMSLALIFPRLCFDMIYCATLKFSIFELGRRPLITTNRISIMWFIRIIQDFTMTSIKVILLNILRFAG